jgi:alkylation response protein AidB-like acyl-CoA dehydrogenase
LRAAFSADEERFRAEVADFLADYRHIDGFYDQAHKWPEVKALFQAMGARGWLALAWPRALGGLDKPISYEYILWDEVGYARAARNPLSAGVVARSIIRFGTDEQKQRWLPPIRSGDMHFSLGYSEPEAGSDLAAVRCRAERRGDVYVVTGQKCWQSYAEDMDYLWLLCRTGAADSRSGGLTLLIVDLKAPGVTVAPLPTIDGHQLNEIHLDGVEVPLAQRVGPEGGAWKIMSEALADERHIQFPPKRVRRDLEEIVAWVREIGLAEDVLVRRTLAELATQVREAEMHSLLVLHAMQKGQSGAVEAAANKVAQSVVCQNIARSALEFGGPHALVKGTRVEHLWRQTMWETIGGGTSEIMLSVVARQSLGLGARA